MENKKVNILIGTPAYNGMVHIDFVNSIMDMHRLKIPFSLMQIGNESLITRGRNTILSYFHDMKQFTHLLFIDADIKIAGEDVIKLLSHDVDIIGAPVALKGYDEKGNKVYNVVNPEKIEDKDLYKCDKVGTAVFMLSRKACDSLVEDAINKNDIYSSNKHTRGNGKQVVMYDVFKTGIDNGEYLSEDFFVCNTLRELGYTIYVDDKIKIVHNGMFQF